MNKRDHRKTGRATEGRTARCARLLAAMLILTVLFVTGTGTQVCRAAEGDTSGMADGAQAADPFSGEAGFSAVLYNNANGLPTSEANAIAETADGFLWIGSYGGLTRYDGNSFVPVEGAGITGVNCLCADSKGRLWIGTNDSGIFLMEKGQLRHFGTEDGLRSSSVRAVVEGPDGTVYAATTKGIVLFDEELSVSVQQDARIGDAYIGDLRAGADGLIYGLTNSGDLFTLKDGKVEHYLDHGNSRLGALSAAVPDSENPGMLFVETEDSLSLYGKFDGGFGTMEILDTGSLTQIQEFRRIGGMIWICGRNGIGVITEDGFYALEDFPMNNSVCQVTTDYEGNLWFASTRQGVMKIVPNRFTDLFERHGLVKTVVNSTCVYDGLLFIGTDSGLTVLGRDGALSALPLSKAKSASGYHLGTTDLLQYLDGCRIRSIIRDSRGRLWISTWRNKGLLRYDDGELLAFSTGDGLYSDHIRSVVEREDGSYLVACTGGVNIIEEDRVVAGYGEADGIGNTEILTVAEGEAGDILAGSDGGGIYVIGGQGVRRIGMEDGLTSEAVMRIKADRKRGIYWVVTGSSLAYLSSDYTVTTLDHFPYFNNFDLYENSRGEMWILSGNGVYISTVDDLLANEGTQPAHFGIGDGLPCIPTANSYSELTQEGNLYIAGTEGVSKINVDEPLEGVSGIRIAIPYLEADGTRIYADESGVFHVGSRVRKLTVHGFAFNFSLTDPVVSYQLEGFDPESISVRRSEFAPVVYTNLRGGDYRFVLRLIDPLNRESSSMSVEIVKARAITEQGWFYAALLFAAALAIHFSVMIHVRKKMRLLEEKHQEEKEKERISTELGMANRIQTSTLPHVFPPFPDRTEFDIYAAMQPAREVGGDFYDFYMIDDDHLCLVIADVSGKGIPAALFMMISRAVLQSCAIPGRTAGEALEKMNDAICARNQVDMFVTVWIGILEISTGRLDAANAGHEYPAVMHDGKFELLKDKHGFVIGGMEGMRYRDYEIVLKPGDRIFVYTDGVPEATDGEGAMFGTERMLDALNEDACAGTEKILDNVRKAVDVFVGGAEQFDDLTMMCLEYRGKV
ncbi:MAG: SpoIIE family protein phosphatase [Lachnospiraceae bacterium]|nr:SpoIIE family protein phosphatase [Lachnospiraceae bacterium]